MSEDKSKTPFQPLPVPTSDGKAKIGFQMRIIRLALEDILPVRQIDDAQKKANRYEIILASIKTEGLVEPLVVFPQKGQPGKYMLVNGHMRYYAMKELELSFADCLIAIDDESFTYNARVSRLPAIQEHKMITRAVKNGASLERIAAALNISPVAVKATMNLLNGINEEAVDLLKDKHISPQALRMMKKVTSERQVAIARMMIEADNYHAGYVEGLVLGTRKDLLVAANLPKKKERDERGGHRKNGAGNGNTGNRYEGDHGKLQRKHVHAANSADLHQSPAEKRAHHQVSESEARRNLYGI